MYLCEFKIKKLLPSDIFLDKAKTIRMVVTDIDGVLTDGSIIYDNKGKEIKVFNVKDGQIVKPLRESGIVAGVISGRESGASIHRCTELGFDFHKHGIADKWTCLTKYLKQYNLTSEECAYVGDDLGDLAILGKVGLSACPADAPEYIQSVCHLVLQKNGGQGCFREFADIILKAQNKFEAITSKYLRG